MKYYWLKLHTDFFMRHDVQILEAQENGREFVLFYLKLMAESVDHEGRLRFSEAIPYTAETLAIITRTPVEIAVKALDIFKDLKLIETDEAGTILITLVPALLGYETAWAEKKRAQRQQKDTKGTTRGQKGDNVPNMSPTCPQHVPKGKGQDEDNKRTTGDNVRQEKEIEKEIEIDKKKKQEKEKAQAPRARFSVPEVNKAFDNFIKSREKRKKPVTDEAADLLIKQLEELTQDPAEQAAIINQSTRKGWCDFYPLDKKNKKEIERAGDIVEDFEKFIFTG